jgi:phospholipase/carboxylesterase
MSHYHAALHRKLLRGSAVSLEAVEIETGPRPTGSVIWLHGLGADGHDFEPIVPELVSAHRGALRFVFPHAPVRPVTLNGGFRMRAWYDILAIDRGAPQDEAGIRASQAAVEELIRRENGRGIASARIVLAGFSQGGAIALFAGTRHAARLAGLIGLSCYPLLAQTLAAERAVENLATPIFLGHGLEDPVVAPALGEYARTLLTTAGYKVEWHAYSMPHSVCPEEVADLAAWLRRVLGPAPA